MFSPPYDKIPNPPAYRWHGARTVRFLVRHIRLGLQRWQRKTAIAQLMKLDDRMLNDIGICRNDIPRVVDGLIAPPSNHVAVTKTVPAKRQDEVNELRAAA